MELEKLPERATSASPFRLAIPYAGVLTLANLVPTVAPSSAFLSLLAVLAWFAAALFVFIVVTWLRKDHWLVAGLIIGLTPVVARTVSDVIANTGSFANLDTSLGLLVRAIIAVPVCGGVVYGARWLTELILGSDAPTRTSRKA